MYLISKGLIKPAGEKTAATLGLGLPALAAIMLAIAIFSSASYFASGQHPNLDLSVKSPSAKTAPVSKSPSSSSSGGSNPSASNTPTTTASTIPSTPASQNTSTAISPAPSSVTDTTSGIVGGMGGGSSDPTGSSNPLPATVNVPPIDLQAGDKQILSTDGTSITIN